MKKTRILRSFLIEEEAYDKFKEKLALEDKKASPTIRRLIKEYTKK